ncbi:hypothetical protein [Tardiphaga sp. P5_C10]
MLDVAIAGVGIATLVGTRRYHCQNKENSDMILVFETAPSAYAASIGD